MRLSRDPMFGCCIMFPTDRELAAGTRDIDLGPFPEESFQGFPLRAARVVRKRRDPRLIAADIASCGFNAALLVGFCGANFTPDDVRSPRFVALTRELKRRGISVGVCIPFADTVDNALTRADPRMHQLRRDGKRPFVRFDPDIERPPYPIYIIDYGSARFVRFARAIVSAARQAGMDFIDFAEPDYWPTEDNGYGVFLQDAWRKRFGVPLPFPSTPRHRLFMEDYHLSAVKRISAFAHRQGLSDHLTASPLGHAPYHICQNYGKYAGTTITELSSTYHYLYGLAWRERLSRRYGIDVPEHRISSLGCIEVRSMRRWEERHATYIVPGQSLPAETYANALDQQMFLHNMDVVYWEYPSIRRNYYETADTWIRPADAWRQLRRTFAEKAAAYRALPSAFHGAVPDPEALIFYSKRGVYADAAEDRATPCAYAETLRLITGTIEPLFLYAEDMRPLSSASHSPRIVVLDEHQPMPPGGWKRLAAWLRRGSRVLVYGGGPGLDWETGKPLRAFGGEWRGLFGVTAGRAVGRSREEPCPIDVPLPGALRPLPFMPGARATVIARANGAPFVTMSPVGAASLAVYVAMPLCELPGAYLARLSSWLLARVNGKKVSIESPLDLEHRLYQGSGKAWLAVKNHSTERHSAAFSVACAEKPRRVTELLSGTTIRVESYTDRRVSFSDAPPANSVRIYEITGD